MERGQRGQSSLEATLAVVTLITLATGLLGFSHFLASRLWLEHLVYEALICRAKIQSSASVCESKLKHQFKSFRLLGEVRSFKWRQTQRQPEIELTWKWPLGQATLKRAFKHGTRGERTL